MAKQKKNHIRELDPAHLYEVDGVVFDQDSFIRHCAPHTTGQPAPDPIPEPPDAPRVAPAPAPADAAAPTAIPPVPAAPAEEPQVLVRTFEIPTGAPTPVFLCDPVHVGWYEVEAVRTAYPIMAGAVAPTGGAETVFLTRPAGSGSYASSYATSYMTSYATSYVTSYTTSYITSYRTSYLTSFTTSYLTSFTTSYRTSFVTSRAGSGRVGSGVGVPAAGYGLELI